MTTDIRTKISLDGVQQYQAGAAAAAQSLDRIGQSAALTQRQTRALGSALGDSLRAIGGSAGGPLGEAAQRISQLGNAFGGLDGVAARVTPVVGVVGGLAAAVGVLTVAYKQGKAETDGYAKALVLSGNAVGTTVGQLNELAKSQAAISGSQGKAAEVLTQLAVSGNVAAGELGKAAGAAIRFERAGGAAADETAKKFIELGKDPLKGLIKLNEAENFLTRSVYETVKALEAQGKRAEAATVAQNAYADAVSGRSAQLEPRLGTLQKAWQGVADQAKRAWNAMLNIGREDTLEEKLEQTRARIETQRRRLAGLESSPQAGNPAKVGGQRLVEDAAGNIYMPPAPAGTSAFGTAASTAAGAAVGIYGGRAISGGYAAFGGSGNGTVNAGTAIGAVVGSIVPVIGTAVGAAVGGIIGGVVNRLFGRRAPEVTGRGIEGTITGSDFTGSTVTDVLEKGGVFRSDRRSQISEAITGDLDKALDEGAKSLSDLAGKYGAALGLPAEQLAGVTVQIKVKITDDAAENSKAIADALQQYADALLGTFADDVEPFRKSGETVAQTIERVGGALLTVNDSLELLGVQALATSLDGGQAAIALADLFGDAGTFAQAAGSYYSKFYSEAERADRATQQITETLAQFGLQAPATRDDFRALVEAQDLTTQSGRAAFAALLGVSDAFDALQTAAGDTAQALAEVVQQRKDLETQLLGLQGNTTELRARERAALDESNRALYDQIKALEDQKIAAEEVAKAAEEAAKAADDLANRLRSIQSGADAIVGDFLSGNDLARNRATRINEILTEGGITGGTIEGIIGSTREDIANLWNSVGTAGREAILEAYGLWKDLDQLVRGTSRAVADYRGGTLADSIEGARLGSLSPAARLAELRRLEGEGFAGLASAADPVAAAQKLANIVSQRVALEAQLEDSRGEALRAELQAVERIRDVAQDALQAAAQMRFDDNSSLSARDQLGAARSLFESTVARARAGDQNALGSLIGNAQAFRQEARTALASSPAYAAIDALVTGTLEQFGLAGAGAAGRATELQKQIDALAGIDASLGENGALYKALQRIDTTQASAFGSAAVAPTTGTVTMTGTNGVLTGISETGSSLAVLPPVGVPTDALLQRVLDKLGELVAGTNQLIASADGGNVIEQQQTTRTVQGLGEIRDVLGDIARRDRLAARERNATV